MQICRLCEVGVDIRSWDSAGGPAQWGSAGRITSRSKLGEEKSYIPAKEITSQRPESK